MAHPWETATLAEIAADLQLACDRMSAAAESSLHREFDAVKTAHKAWLRGKRRKAHTNKRKGR